jgi:hypothetical protein
MLSMISTIRSEPSRIPLLYFWNSAFPGDRIWIIWP